MEQRMVHTTGLYVIHGVQSWGAEGYIRMERNIADPSGKCGITIEPSYPVKKGQNPPKPGPTPPSPVKPPTVCDKYYFCPEDTTCCCMYQYGKSCFAWGCCPLTGATCCDDGYSCGPHNYPVRNTMAGTCLTVLSEGNSHTEIRRNPYPMTPPKSSMKKEVVLDLLYIPHSSSSMLS